MCCTQKPSRYVNISSDAHAFTRSRSIKITEAYRRCKFAFNKLKNQRKPNFAFGSCSNIFLIIYKLLCPISSSQSRALGWSSDDYALFGRIEMWFCDSNGFCCVTMTGNNR